MKAKLPMIARYLLGLLFLLSGISFFFMPPPTDLPGNMAPFFNGMMSTGFFFQFLKVTEAVCGLMLLANVAAPVALVILAPICINIFLVHLFLTPGVANLILPVVILCLLGTAASGYWKLYRPLFSKGA